ncbi:MAG: flagellar hook-length control protein FliK [Helicobacteraceae bacterium]|jgi:hypothetical protein|nr:flagellar hook-length control protein FliK [Helicobacteraceae bacterium]
MILAELLKIGIDKSLPKGAQKAALPFEKSDKNFAKLLKNAVETATRSPASPPKEMAAAKTAIARLETKPIKTFSIEPKASGAQTAIHVDEKVDEKTAFQTAKEQKETKESLKKEKSYDPIRVLDIIYKNDPSSANTIKKPSQKSTPRQPIEKTVESYAAHKKLDETLDAANSYNEIKDAAAKKDISKLIEIAKTNNLEPKRIEVVQYNAKADNTVEAYSIDIDKTIKAEKIAPIKTLEAEAPYEAKSAAEVKSKDTVRVAAKTETIANVRNIEIDLKAKTTFSITQKAQEDQKPELPASEKKTADKTAHSSKPQGFVSGGTHRVSSSFNEPPTTIYPPRMREVPVKPAEPPKQMASPDRRELLPTDKPSKPEKTAIKPSNGVGENRLAKPMEDLKQTAVLTGTKRAADPKPRQMARDAVKPPAGSSAVVQENAPAPKSVSSAAVQKNAPTPKNGGGTLQPKPYGQPPKEAQTAAIKNAPLAKTLEYIHGKELEKEKAVSAEKSKEHKGAIETNAAPKKTVELEPAGKKERSAKMPEAKGTLLEEAIKTEESAPKSTIRTEEKTAPVLERQIAETEEKNAVKKTTPIDEKPVEKTTERGVKIEEKTIEPANTYKKQAAEEPIDAKVTHQKTEIITSQTAKKQTVEKKTLEQPPDTAKTIVGTNAKSETKRTRSNGDRANPRADREPSAPKPAETSAKPFAQPDTSAESLKDGMPLKPAAIGLETLFQSIAGAKTFSAAPTRFEQSAQKPVEAPPYESGRGGETERNELPIKNEMANERLFNKIVTARQIVSRFADRLVEAAQNYKPPITRLVIVLDPPEFGRMEVTLTHRGQSLQVSVHSNQQALALLAQNSAEFRQNLLQHGFSDVNISYQNPSGERQRREKQRDWDEKGTEFAFEPEKTPLEMLLYG